MPRPGSAAPAPVGRGGEVPLDRFGGEHVGDDDRDQRAPPALLVLASASACTPESNASTEADSFPLAAWKDAVRTAADKKSGSIKVVLEP